MEPFDEVMAGPNLKAPMRIRPEIPTPSFERGVSPLKASATLEKQRIAKLEAKLVQKNEAVAELLEEHIKLKKELGEL